MDDEEKVDIAIRNVPNSLRTRFGVACREEDLTYEEMLDKFLRFREDKESEFERFDSEKRDRGPNQFRQPDG